MPDQDARLEQFKQKYQSVVSLIQQSGVRLSHMHVQDNKFFLEGEAPSEQIKNKIWDEIKRVDPSYSDLTCELTVNSSLPQPSSETPAQPATGQMQTYTVKPGDTLSKISRQFYGDAGQYMKIFEANRDHIKDPNQIHAGETISIPA